MFVWIAIGLAAGAIGIAVGHGVLPRGGASHVQRAWELRLIQRRARKRGVDPFATLALQTRLSELSRELDLLRAPDDNRFAAAHHLRAAQLAYDDLLDEGCRLAGVDEVEGEGALHRLLAESELRTRGWSW